MSAVTPNRKGTTPLVTETAVEWGVIAHLRDLPHFAPTCPLCHPSTLPQWVREAKS